MADVGNINLRALQLFIAVYDSHSFSVVARREGVSPSLISRVIQQLEDALGQQLFYRNTRAVVPTEAGNLFADYARGMTEQFAHAQRELQDRAQQPGGLVRINAPVYFGQRHIAPWLAGLADRYPELEYELILTDDFVDPHRQATDIIFRISALPDASYHAKVLAPSAITSPQRLVTFPVSARRNRLLSLINTARWCIAVHRVLTVGFFARGKKSGPITRKHRG